MKKYFFLLLLLSEITIGQTPSNDSHWQLLWQDDFNTLDTNIWEVKNHNDHNSPTNCCGELQIYTNRTDNVFTSNGNLVLRAKDESYSCPLPAINQWGCVRQYITEQAYSYTSGWVETKNAFQVQYGYLESRIKLPYGNGFWPAFWTWTGNPSYQEIDIFEMTPGADEYCHRNSSPHFTHTNNISTSNIHYDGPNGSCDDPYAFPSVSQISDYTQWHTYGIEWSPTRIIWYLDNYPVRYYLNAGITAPTTVIINFAISGTGGSFPADMLADYVKVYQLNEDCSDYINSTTYDFSTYNNIEKNFIKIGQGGGSNSLTNGQDVKLRASQFIEISGDFTVPLGASLYLDANKDCSTDLELECTQTFNPCAYDFSNYDNSVKNIIELGGNDCNMTITPTNGDILLQATDEIHIESGVIIAATPEHSFDLKIVPCPH